MARLLIGAALMPSAVIFLWAACRAVGGLTVYPRSSWPFLTGFSAMALAWVFPVGWVATLARRGYVLGHELTHALAAWSVGAEVFGFKIGADGGHVDLSRSNAYIALAPYCVPIYTLLVVAGYRALLYVKPDAGGLPVFLFLIGLTIAFHLIKTFETIWDRKQPDLSAAGGIVFALSWIFLFNGMAVLLLLKVLFPAAVDLGASLRLVMESTLGFWRGLYALFDPLRRSFVVQLKRP